MSRKVEETKTFIFFSANLGEKVSSLQGSAEGDGYSVFLLESEFLIRSMEAVAQMIFNSLIRIIHNVISPIHIC